jgi:hypothetical protein
MATDMEKAEKRKLLSREKPQAEIYSGTRERKMGLHAEVAANAKA